MERRRSGILLHITSLPSRLGIGDMGPEAYRFVNFLAECKQSFWQILPLNPTDPAYGNSPYNSISAFASNSLLISPELMVQDGLLAQGDVEPFPGYPKGRVDYNAAISYKKDLFYLAYERFKKTKNHDEYELFCSENARWLDDFALFAALKAHFNGHAWNEWPPEIQDRQSKALQLLKKELHENIEMEKFLQYTVSRQWFSLKGYCNQKGIQIIGDIPIYVGHDSVDLWVNSAIFRLDDTKRPYVISGAPPGYFSKTGQVWGNPLYRWDVLKEKKYDWWVYRMEHTLNLFDLVRVDHFRGLVAYWEISAGEQTAINGRWVEVPVYDFFNTLRKRFPSFPIIAEDLGFITPDVREVMRHFGFPGMKVLLFAFGEDDSMHPFLPHTYEHNAVVYTGTHDNNTVRGWFEREAQPDAKERLFRYLGREVSSQDIHWELIRLAMSSIADLAIIPMQDILGLEEDARMNRPNTGEGNWEWQLVPDQIKASVGEKLREMTETYGRAPAQSG
jgi:4-alpha-glucanotransferase